MLPLVDTGTGEIGWMEPKVWQYIVDELGKQGVLRKPINARDVYTLRFLNEVFEKTGGSS